LDKVLQKYPTDEFALKNKNEIRLYFLREKALDLHKQKMYNEALSVYDTILASDPTDSFAIKNKAMIIEYKIYSLKQEMQLAIDRKDQSEVNLLADSLLQLESTNHDTLIRKQLINGVQHQ
jgi:tetratricopeptide (TPR) repeat protein